MTPQFILKLSSTCFFVGLLIFSSIKFYQQPLPPSSEPLHNIYDWLHGGPRYSAKPAIVSMNLDLELQSEETGPNVWGGLALVSFFVLVGIGIFAEFSPTKETVASIVAQWRLVDEERVNAAKITGIFKRRLDRVDRYRAAQISLDRADRILMEFYETELRHFSTALWLAVACFGLIVIGLSIFLLINPRATDSLVDTQAASSLTQLSARLIALERGSSYRTIYMAAVIIIGLVTMLLTGFVSVWKVKSIARKKMRDRLSNFRESFQNKLLKTTERTETALDRQVSAQFELEETIEASRCLLKTEREAALKQIDQAVAEELAVTRELARLIFEAKSCGSGAGGLT